MRLVPIVTCITLAVLAGCASGAKRNAATEDVAEPRAGCVSGTGSRIEQSSGQRCHSGRTVTRDELERSGGTATGDALGRVITR